MLEIAFTAFCVLICFSAMWIALSYGIKMCQNAMRPQPTVILILNVQERRRTVVPEANRHRAQENDEPINLWMDQENFGEFVFLCHNLPHCWANRISFKSFLSKKIHEKYGASRHECVSSFILTSETLRTFSRKFSNIDFFLQILPLKDDELVMSEM